jgi:hypothetical protein
MASGALSRRRTEHCLPEPLHRNGDRVVQVVTGQRKAIVVGIKLSRSR